MADELSPKAQTLLDSIVRGKTATARNITKELQSSNTIEIVYTDDQLKVFDQTREFLRSTKVSCAIVGAAGTGKTTLLNKLIQGISKVAISAPTHAAKLQAGIRSGVRTTYTVAELAGLNPDVDIADFDPNKPKFAQKREPKIKDHKVHIIDEASMLNRDLKNTLVELAEEYQVQIIFVGDPCQLPPVGESTPAAFEGEDVYTLHTIVRQSKENPLTYILAVLRYMQELYTYRGADTKERFDDIFELVLIYQPDIDYNTLYENRKDMFFYLLTNVKADIVDGKGWKVAKDSEEFYQKAVKGIDEGGRLLAFTNNTVAECNNQMRIRKGLTKEFEIGEIITGYKTLRDDKNNMFFTNSLDYKILGKQAKISMNDFQVIRLELIDNFYFNKTYIDVLHKSEYTRFIDKYHTALQDAKNRGQWPKFFCFKDAHCITRYNNGGEVLKSDFDYGYALTIHKSQGSTYKYVYTRIDDVMRYVKTEEYRYTEEEIRQSILFGLKLIYVALSRATDVAIIKL